MRPRSQAALTDGFRGFIDFCIRQTNHLLAHRRCRRCPKLLRCACAKRHDNRHRLSEYLTSVCRHRRGAGRAHPYRAVAARSGAVGKADRRSLPDQPRTGAARARRAGDAPTDSSIRRAGVLGPAGAGGGASAVASCLGFGQYRIVEAELADHDRVSRTGARDVLSRLQERGLVRKNQSSHWVAGPLTAKDIRELYELRAALEPVALRGAVRQTTRETLQALCERCSASQRRPWTADMIDRIESDLHESLLLATTNDRLAESLRHIQLPLVETERFLRSLGLPIDPRIVDEHRIIYELLLHDAVDAAAAALTNHLQAESRRSIIHLKTAAVFTEPPPLASYLARRVGY